MDQCPSATVGVWLLMAFVGNASLLGTEPEKPQVHDWESAVGTKLRAEFIQVSWDATLRETVTVLKRESDGKELVVPFSKLSDRSKSLARQLAAEARAKAEAEAEAKKRVAAQDKSAEELRRAAELRAKNDAALIEIMTPYMGKWVSRDNIKTYVVIDKGFTIVVNGSQSKLREMRYDITKQGVDKVELRAFDPAKVLRFEVTLQKFGDRMHINVKAGLNGASGEYDFIDAFCDRSSEP